MRQLRFIFIAFISFLSVTGTVFLRRTISIFLCGVLNFNSASCYSLLDKHGTASAAVPPSNAVVTTNTAARAEHDQKKVAGCFLGICKDIPNIPIPNIPNIPNISIPSITIPNIPNIPNAPNGDLLGSLKTLIIKLTGEAVGVGSPLLLDQNTAFEKAPNITDFHPIRLTTTSVEDLQKSLPPGDYSVPVVSYCTQFSIHAPGQGLPYKLARLQGKQAPAVSALLARGTLQNIAPATLNANVWRIEAGLPLKQWSPKDQALIHSLIPEYEEGLQGDYLQQIEDTYNQLRFPGIPPLNDLLREIGAPGQLVLQLRQARQVLSDQTISAERLPEMLYEPTNDGLPRVLPASKDSSPSPWGKVQPGVFARFTVIEGYLGRNLLEFRIMPKVSAVINDPAITVANKWDKKLQVSEIPAAVINAPTLAKVMGMNDSTGQSSPLLIGYSIGHPAQALISSMVFSPYNPTTVYLGGAGMNGPYIPDQIQALKDVGIKNVLEGKYTWGNKFDLADAFIFRDHTSTEQPFTLELLGIKDNGENPLNFIGYSYGSLIAAQSAIYYANNGRKVSKLVLIGSPISQSFLDELNNHPNIEKVKVINLTQYGDPIYAGMSAPELLKVYKLWSSENGHFYYSLNSDEGKKRRRALAQELWNEGLR